MLRVGLTGGLATGKSTVGRWLAELGCHVIRYDEVGHQVLEPDGEAYASIVEAFGEGILNPDRSINRRALGEIVFADPAKLKRLESLAHPPTHRRVAALIEQYAAADPHGIVIIEAAILVETGTYRNFDRLIVVACRPEQQLERAIARGLTRQQAADRLARQLPLEEKVARADFVIDTSQSMAASRSETEAVYRELAALAAESNIGTEADLGQDSRTMNARRLLLAALLAGGFVLYTSYHHDPDDPAGSSRTAPRIWDNPLWSGPIVAQSAGLGDDENNNIEVYKQARESVVYITSTVYQREYFFFREVVREAQGIGSGFLINAEGQILTNNHVISGSQKIQVTLPDQTQHEARVLVRDPVNDLALIEIDAPEAPLPFLPLGDSDNLQVGQKVLAIGNPLGLDNTLTTGIVSSLERTIPGQDMELSGMIQTDAAINHGNSGGPLLDSSGNVIGINTAIFGEAGSIGIGFAMPINRAKRMLDDFRGGLRPASPRIGVTTIAISGDLAEALKFPRTGGLYVQQVERNSPAASAGLLGGQRIVRYYNGEFLYGGDLIIEVDGKAIERRDEISRAAMQKHAGETLDLTILREGQRTTITITLDGYDGPGGVI